MEVIPVYENEMENLGGLFELLLILVLHTNMLPIH